jgi:Fic family protein
MTLHEKSVSSFANLSKRQKASVLKLFTYLENNPIIDIGKTATALELSYNTISKAVSLLVERGILVQNKKSGPCYYGALDFILSKTAIFLRKVRITLAHFLTYT